MWHLTLYCREAIELVYAKCNYKWRQKEIDTRASPSHSYDGSPVSDPTLCSCIYDMPVPISIEDSDEGEHWNWYTSE